MTIYQSDCGVTVSVKGSHKEVIRSVLEDRQTMQWPKGKEQTIIYKNKYTENYLSNNTANDNCG